MSKAFVIPSIFTAVDRMSSVVKTMTGNVTDFASKADAASARAERKWRSMGATAFDVAKKSFVVGAAIATPLILAANEAIKFEDKMADVGKTTGLAGTELESFGKDILDMSTKTRTSIDDLVKIAEIGGQLGIAKKDLISFTKASDQFNVALGKDFSGGVEDAISSVGKIKSLFAQTRDLNIADSIQKTGSAINELGAVGAGTSANITDFTLRIGALPDAMKPSLSSALALGTFLEELGIDSQIGSGGLTNFFLVAGKNIPGFAKQMGIGSEAAKSLLKSDPTEFAKKFAVSLKGLSPDKLANTLKHLKVESQESIKVIGALGSGTDRLTELQDIANKSFGKGTSLIDEYNKKNNTTRAQLEKAQNNFQAFSIMIGTQVLPILHKLIEIATPVVKSIISWTKSNPALIKTIVGLAVGIAALSFAISGISFLVGIYTKAQLLLNAAMLMNPIGLIIIGITALIILVATIINKWNEWGAALSLFLGPLGMIISLVQAFRRNWEMISLAFKSEGMIGGLKAIGKTIIDVILMPLEQLMGIISKFTGFDWAASAQSGLHKLRTDIGVNTTTDESGNALPTKELLSTKAAQQDAILQQNENTNNAKVAITIKDPNNRTSAESDNDLVEIKTTSTMAWGG